MLDNRYRESPETSGGYLRIALQHIAKHNLPYDPITYAVWYEYASGRNETLRTDLDKLGSDAAPLTYDTMVTLFRKYLADGQVLLAEKKTREFQAILSEMARHLGTSGGQLDAKGKSLNLAVKELTRSTTLETVSQIARQIVVETRSVMDSSQAIQNRVTDTQSEIDLLRQELEGIKEAARTDVLTNLLNRRGFDEAMTEALKNRGTDPLSIILLDIDHFKKVNDTHGHLIGDNVLKLLARLIQDHTKGKDVAARFGGEEFILLLPETPLKGAYVLAEQIRLSLRRMRWMTKHSGKSIGAITISTGVAEYRPDEPVETLIERADNALYHAKNTGRNRSATEMDLE